MQGILIAKKVGIVRGLCDILPDVIRGIAIWTLSFLVPSNAKWPIKGH